MINLALGKRPVDDVAEIAERFDEGELKAVVADGRLVEWLTDRFEDEIAERVKALGDTGGDDFAERLIAALWPDPESKDAKTARDHVIATRERATEAERQRQEAAAAKAKAEAEKHAKKAEAEKLAAVLAAERERKRAAQAKAEKERRAQKAETGRKEDNSTSSRAMALLQRIARSEADSHHLREARLFKIRWVNRKMDGWGIGVVFLDRNFREIGVKTSIMVDEYDAHMRPGSIVALGAALKPTEAKTTRPRVAAARERAAKAERQRPKAEASEIPAPDEEADDDEEPDNGESGGGGWGAAGVGAAIGTFLGGPPGGIVGGVVGRWLGKKK